MSSRRRFWVVLLTGAVLTILLARYAFDGESLRSLRRAPRMNQQPLETRSSYSPILPSAPTIPSHKPTPTPTPTPTPPDKALSGPPSTPEKHLRDSPTRLNAIDALSNFSDVLFLPQNRPASWSVNQQDLDQIDYRSADGSTAITKWFGDGDAGKAHLRAEEAQLPNGEVVDRWYHPNGYVKQIEHRYPDGRSNSVYYYDDGTVEATRSARGEHEIFTKYDRNGRQVERTVQ